MSSIRRPVSTELHQNGENGATDRFPLAADLPSFEHALRVDYAEGVTLRSDGSDRVRSS
jgi:hypothetical protein